MHTRYMERTESMARGKRSSEGGDDEDEQQQPERKRPALASVIVEALKVDSLQKLCSSLEPILRRVVSEEVERALAKLGPPRVNGSFRTSPKRIEGPGGRKLQLQFRSRLAPPLFTGGKVEGEQGAAVHVVLFDANTGHVVTSGPEASAKLDVVVLEGDFNNEDEEDWTEEEFESHLVKEREGKRPLLTGELQVVLKEGVGTLGEFTFTDNSSWIRSRKFRLGAKVASGYCEGMRVREAKSEAFAVKDHRGELYKKHYPPALTDEVWRLEKIGKDGSFHKKLNQQGISSVEDFLRLYVKDPQKLRSILGSGMSNKMWEALLEHAKTCVLSGKLYIYYPEDSRNVGVMFDNIYQLNGLISGDQYYSADSLSDEQKVYVDTLVKKAYENWNQVVEYDGKSLLSFKQTKQPTSSRTEAQIVQPHALDHHTQLQRLPAAVLNDNSSAPSSATGVLGFNDNMDARYASLSQVTQGNPHSQFVENMSYAPHEHSVVHQSQTSTGQSSPVGGLALHHPPPQASPYQTLVGSPFQQSGLTPFDGWGNSNNRDNDFLTEEDIRMRSNQMLENEDMQHLLRLFSMGGHHQGSMNVPDDAFSFPYMAPSPMPTNYDMDRMRPTTGKAVVGWLKIKAAMRWGFFIRKKAAERRAQLVELDEEEE
ncbi:Calmodulin-binding protein 60 B [Linum grandiflorum]